MTDRFTPPPQPPTRDIVPLPHARAALLLDRLHVNLTLRPLARIGAYAMADALLADDDPEREQPVPPPTSLTAIAAIHSRAGTIARYATARRATENRPDIRNAWSCIESAALDLADTAIAITTPSPPLTRRPFALPGRWFNDGASVAPLDCPRAPHGFPHRCRARATAPVTGEHQENMGFRPRPGGWLASPLGCRTKWRARRRWPSPKVCRSTPAAPPSQR